MATARLTKRLVESMSVSSIIWDTDVKGFGVRRQGSRRIYMLKARLNGRQRWFTIGEHGSPWTAETARQEAQRLWGEIRQGSNLAAIREARRNQPTVTELAERYLAEHGRPYKKPLSVAADERNLRNHILPLLGSRTVMEVTREDIERLKRQVREGASKGHTQPRDFKRQPGGRRVAGGPGAANRCIELLSKMFNLAEDWGWRSEQTNPCHRIAHYPKRFNQRFLSSAEIDQLGASLKQMEADGLETTSAIAAVRLLLLTGARLSEIMGLRWEWIDIERQVVNLPDSKTGQKPLFLSPSAIEVLEGIDRLKGNPYVITGTEPGKPLGNLQPAWRRIKQHACLDGVRIHDLRHTFASLAASSGASLPMIGKLLGHTQPRTTARYAHLVHDPLKEMNDKVGSRLLTSLGQRPRPTPALPSSIKKKLARA